METTGVIRGWQHAAHPRGIRESRPRQYTDAQPDGEAACGKQSFQALAGEPIQLSIAKITVYDNPAQAREPGLYVAADYVNEYRNVPVHCGYLMWFRPPGGGDFRVTREETGHITAEQLRTIPAEQLPAIKRSLRCVTP